MKLNELRIQINLVATPISMPAVEVEMAWMITGSGSKYHMMQASHLQLPYI